jgi:putative hydrolase of the HAD superfamily
MTYEAVIFDLFGTLIDNFSFRDYERSLSAMAATLGVPNEDFHRLWRETAGLRGTGGFATIEANLEHICQQLGLKIAAARIVAASRIRLDLTRRTLTLWGDAVSPLARLKAQGYKIGRISDCAPEVPRLWPETRLAPLVDVPIFSCQVGVKKPDPRIYRLACERLHVIPQHGLYVGDGSSHELIGASLVGMHPVLLRVPYEEALHASLRPDAEEEWQGVKVAALREVLTMVDQGLGVGA